MSVWSWFDILFTWHYTGTDEGKEFRIGRDKFLIYFDGSVETKCSIVSRRFFTDRYFSAFILGQFLAAGVGNISSSRMQTQVR